MPKFTDAVRTTLSNYFNAGDQPTEAQFTELMARIQEGLDLHDHTEQAAGDGLKALGSTAGPLTLTIANVGLHLLDTDASHDLIISPGSNLTADRTLMIATGDAARTVTLAGNPTLADWFDQPVKAGASPTFADVFTTDGGTFGISGNELLTVKTAGTFEFSGITGVSLESLDWLGLGAAKGRIKFNDLAIDELNFLSCRVGLGTDTPFLNFGSAAGDFGATYGGIHIYGGSHSCVLIEGDDDANIYLSDRGAAVNDKNLLMQVQGGNFTIGSMNDALDAWVEQNIINIDMATGEVGIGAGPQTPAKLTVQGDVAANYLVYFINDGDNINRHGMVIQAGADNGATVGITYYYNAFDGNGDPTGEIKTVDGVFQLTDVSDKERKTNIKNTAFVGLDIVNRLKVRDYNWKANPTGPVMTSFIAQEAQEAFPAMVSEMSDGSLGTSRAMLIPVLVKAIQEQQTRIEALEAK